MSQLVNARSALINNEVFLGGNFIEIGIRDIGSYGTRGQKPDFFFGNPSNNVIGLTSDADGFGFGQDLRLDYFMPGSPSEGFAWGYTINGSQVGNNFSNTDFGSDNISTVVNTDLTGTMSYDLAAKTTYFVVADSTNILEVESLVYFNDNWKFFWTEVSAKNISGSILSDVRFIRAFDPDNDQYFSGGDFTTHNNITAVFDTDGYSAVQAKSIGADYITAAGSPAIIFFYSEDSLARTSIGSSDFGVNNAYDITLHDNLADNNTREMISDVGISISKALGTLQVNETFNFRYLTSLGSLSVDDLFEELVNVTLPSEPQTITVENSQIVDGAIIQQGNLSSISVGLTVNEKFVSAMQSLNDQVSDIPLLMIDGAEFIGQFDIGLAGFIGTTNRLLSPSELITMSRAAFSVQGTSVERAYQDFSMSTQITNQLLSELGNGAIRYIYAGDFQIIDQGTGIKTFSVDNKVTAGLIDVLNISKSGTDQILVSLDGFTGMSIMGAGVDISGSSNNDYIFAQGDASYNLGFGNDILALNGMNALINGGAGADVVRVFGNSFTVSVLDIGGQLSVTNGLGTSLLTNIEFIVLDDGYYSFIDNDLLWETGSVQSLNPINIIGLSDVDLSL